MLSLISQRRRYSSIEPGQRDNGCMANEITNDRDEKFIKGNTWLFKRSLSRLNIGPSGVLSLSLS